VIHFPIALLMVAPLFIALAAGVGRDIVQYSRAALVLLVLGTVATFVAVETGEAAAEGVIRTDAINAVLSQHADLAETTRMVFTVLTVLYAAFLFLPSYVARLGSLAREARVRAGNLVFLVLSAAAMLLVVNTAHLGGRLVYQLGVRGASPASPAAGAQPR
jgi:uncharacterized membrane protein